jgi:hypothetical protein
MATSIHTIASISSNHELNYSLEAYSLLWKSQGQPSIFIMQDFGCNEGNLTTAMYNRALLELSSHISISILGVDLDNILM